MNHIFTSSSLDFNEIKNYVISLKEFNIIELYAESIPTKQQLIIGEQISHKKNIAFILHYELIILRILKNIDLGRCEDEFMFHNLYYDTNHNILDQELKPTKDGDFDTKWIGGFFDERADELFYDKK